MMKIGLIDVDGHNFPNLPLMKISAYHKAKGDTVEWYETMFSSHMDIVFMSMVLDFTDDYQYYIDADVIIKGGTGYAEPTMSELPSEIEHIYPDYSIYHDLTPETKNTAYGFLTRECPRGCDFCIVADKEGRCSKKVAELSEFWNGQRYIKLLDPNMFACKDWRHLSQQLIDSQAWIDFTQGCDIKLMTEEKLSYIKQMKIKMIHFAWDNYEDKETIVPKFKMVKEYLKWDKRKLSVYVLVNYNTTLDQDLDRIYTLRDLGYWPYVMVYNKDKLPPRHYAKQLQRWVNMRAVFDTVKTFEEYVDK